MTEEAIPVPSGQAVTLQDVVLGEPGPDGLTARFRFIAPAIARDGGSVGAGLAADDMLHLCTAYALPRVAVTGPMPAQIVISMADRPVVFGEATPEATQFFEAFRIENGRCIWEPF